MFLFLNYITLICTTDSGFYKFAYGCNSEDDSEDGNKETGFRNYSGMKEEFNDFIQNTTDRLENSLKSLISTPKDEEHLLEDLFPEDKYQTAKKESKRSSNYKEEANDCVINISDKSNMLFKPECENDKEKEKTTTEFDDKNVNENQIKTDYKVGYSKLKERAQILKQQITDKLQSSSCCQSGSEEKRYIIKESKSENGKTGKTVITVEEEKKENKKCKKCKKYFCKCTLISCGVYFGAIGACITVGVVFYYEHLFFGF